MEPIHERYCPVLRFHPEETSYPCTGEFLCEHVGLYNKDTKVRECRHVTDTVLREHNSPKFGLDLNTSALVGQIYSGLNGVPIYWHAYEYGEETHLQYVFVYANNPGYDCCCCLLGYHQSDVEHVTLVIRGGVVTRVYFAAHGSTQGLWVPAHLCEWGGDTGCRLVVYSAKGSHASYPRVGTYYRVFGFANDHCSDKGFSSDRVHLLEMPDAEWTKYKGTLAPTGVDPPRRQAWFGHEDGSTITWWQRFFGCWKK